MRALAMATCTEFLYCVQKLRPSIPISDSERSDALFRSDKCKKHQLVCHLIRTICVMRLCALDGFRCASRQPNHVCLHFTSTAMDASRLWHERERGKMHLASPWLAGVMDTALSAILFPRSCFLIHYPLVCSIVIRNLFGAVRADRTHIHVSAAGHLRR